MLRELFPGRCERLFERYCSSGDTHALAAVFDLTARELAALSARLSGSREQAADLVQATYLAAMESAASWDRSRRVMPWLVGILVREARAQRRREGRELDPSRLAPHPVEDPLCAAGEQELCRAVAGALEGVPEKYRQVLALHLAADKSPGEIAVELGRSSGAVRVQLHRGLALLRRALPAGFAAGGALAVLSPRALGEVRSRVLSRAASVRPPQTLGPAIVGGFAMKKSALVALVCLALGGVWLLRTGSSREQEAEQARGTQAAEVRSADVAPVPDLRASEGAGAFTADRALSLPPGRAEDAPVRSGIRGRLVEVDGRPVSGTRVELASLPLEVFLLDVVAALDPEAPAARPLLASTTTDAEGRFTLEGTTPEALHALSIDPSGPRASLRILEEALHAGQATDLGDLVLAPAGTLKGRIVDASGQPVAGARVRVAALPELVLALGLHAWRAGDELVARFHRRDALAHVELPAWVPELLDRFPIPTAWSEADGSFTLRAPLGRELTLVADDPRHAPGLHHGLSFTTDSAHDVGTVRLPAARPLSARVVDASGQPLEEVELRGGSLDREGRLARCLPAALDGDGIHRCLGTGAGPAVFLVRRVGEPWQVAGPYEGDGIHEVRIAPLHRLVLEARDDPGRGVRNLRVALQAAAGLGVKEETAFLASLRPSKLLADDEDATRFVIAGLPAGTYRLFASAEGHAPLRQTIDVQGAQPPVRLEFRERTPLHVRVLAGASETPLADVAVSLGLGRQGRITRVDHGRTDGDGRITLRWAEMLPREKLQLRAELAGHGVAGVGFEAGEAALAQEVVLRLAELGRLVGRVLEGGRAPTARYLVVLQPFEEALRRPANVPFHAVTDGEGRFEVSGLPPGDHWVQVGEPCFSGDPLPTLLAGRLGESFDADKGLLERRLHQGALRIEAGAESKLEVELEPDGPASASVRGRATRSGRGMGGLEIELDLEDARTSAVRTSDAGGAFDFGRVPPGRARLKVEDLTRGRTLLRTAFELQPGEERALDLVFDPLTVDFLLADPDGLLADAELELRSLSALYDGERIHARSDASGVCRVTLPGCGAYEWSVARGARRARGLVDVASAETLRLDCRVLIALPVEFARELILDERRASVWVTDASTSEVSHAPLDRLDSSALVLELPAPGRYTLTAQCGARQSRPVEVEVTLSGVVEPVRFLLAE